MWCSIKDRFLSEGQYGAPASGEPLFQQGAVLHPKATKYKCTQQTQAQLLLQSKINCFHACPDSKLAEQTVI